MRERSVSTRSGVAGEDAPPLNVERKAQRRCPGRSCKSFPLYIQRPSHEES